MEILRQNISKLINSSSRNILLIRSGENVSNLAGTLAGWTDCKLSEYGKKQANLLYEGLYDFLPKFKGIYCSDLQRAKDSLNFATLHSINYNEDERLREIYFGDHEGEHFDSMPEELKNNINSMDYHAPNGENWVKVNRRAYNFLNEKCRDKGCFLIVTHGGLICSITHPLGITNVLPNASIAGITLTNDSTLLQFTWNCPEILNK